jgi:hypothetical protein
MRTPDPARRGLDDTLYRSETRLDRDELPVIRHQIERWLKSALCQRRVWTIAGGTSPAFANGNASACGRIDRWRCR